MKYFIDDVISLMSAYTTDSNESEMKEQESAPAGGGGGASGGGGSTSYPNVPKWAETVGGPKRGKANMLGADGEVWSTGINRGVANQIW